MNDVLADINPLQTRNDLLAVYRYELRAITQVRPRLGGDTLGNLPRNAFNPLKAITRSGDDRT